MSWSIKILFLYLGFVALILTLVFRCFGHPTELEYKDYYARELKFQDQINAANNLTLLDETISHKVEGRTVLITIPAVLLTEDLSAEVTLMRPSDASLDKTIALIPNANGECLIESAELQKGIYKMKILAKSQGKNYFKEAVIRLK
jgi:hypothetical protein